MELANILRFPEYMSIPEYTKVAGVSVNTARNRIKAHLISYIKIDQVYLINTEHSPVRQQYNSGSKKVGRPLLPGVSESQLRSVKSYARGKKRRGDIYFTAILSGKIKGVVIGSEVFAYLHELDTL